MLTSITLGGRLDRCARDLVVEELIKLAKGADFTEFLVLDTQFEDFLDGENNFLEGQ